MVLSKRQKILAVALGAAVAVFIADHILVGLDDIGPAEARAWQIGDVDLAPLVPKDLLPAAPVSEVTTHSEATLADRLEQAVENNELESTTVKDAFCPSGSWSGMDMTERAPLGSVEAIAAAFSERHRLTATAVGAGRDGHNRRPMPRRRAGDRWVPPGLGDPQLGRSGLRRRRGDPHSLE